MQKKTDRVALGVVGCLALLLAGLVAMAVVVVVLLARSADSATESDAATETSAGPASMSPPRRPWEPLSAGPCAHPPGTAMELAEPLRVHDPARVDLAELYDQARSLVLRLEPNAELVTISALKEAAGGTFDSAAGNFSFNFEYRCLRAGAPPGQDLAQGMLLVFAQGGTVRATRVPVAQAPTLASRGALPEPPCSTVAAWTTAVASGVPADARATFVYMEATGSAGGASWLISVPGHPFRREIDGETCRLRSHSAVHPDLTDPGVELPELHPTALPASSAAPAAPTAEPTAEPLVEPTAEPGPSPSGGVQAPPPGTGSQRPQAGTRPPAPEPKGSSGSGGCTLSANAVPPSQVVLDGRPLGSTPKLNVPVSCGPHAVIFIHAEMGRKTVSITPTAGKPAVVTVKF